jgi:hypothetical protein
MSPVYGEKSRNFLSKQKVYEEAEKDPPLGLDSEESAIIQGTYRQNMGGSVEESKDSSAKVLLVQEEKK